MGKVSKATKKFQSKHLKHTLEQRKKVKEHNKKMQGRRGNKGDKKELTSEEKALVKSQKEEVFKDMDVEEYFEEGINLPVKGSKKAGKQAAKQADPESSEEEDHEEEMAALAEKDPEFYKYLQENDKELLDFAGSNPLDNVSEDEDDDEEGEKQEKESGSEKVEVTLKMVKQWAKDLKKPNVKLIKTISAAFKAAINMNKEDAVDEYKYAVTDVNAFKELMFVALKDLPLAIQKLCPYKTVKGARTVPSNATAKQLTSVLKSHAASLLTMLQDITNTETAALVLKSTMELLPFFLSFRKVLKELVNSIVHVWSTTTDVETQIATFAFLSQSSREFKKSLLELNLKATYSTFIKNCRQTNVHTMPMLNFQKNSAVELFGLDETLSYQTGFEYVRQLAIHLRNSLNNNKTAEAYKTIYNWQFCHSLDFWSRVLSQHCNPVKEQGTESPLRQLIYPLVQVTIGAIRLIPTAQFFPLRFYLIRSLIRLSQNTGVFIPIYPLLSEILSSTAFSKVPKGKASSGMAQFDFDHNIKVNQAYLGTKIYQDGLCEQFTELLGEFFVLYCKNISFPELATPVLISLRRYIKTSKNFKFNKQLQQVLEKINANTDFILQKRSKVEFGPNNRAEVDRFLSEVAWDKTPLGSFVAIQREVKEEKMRILRESLAEDEAERKKAKEVDQDDDVEMSDASDISEEDDE